MSFDEHVSNFDKFQYIIFFFNDYCFLYTKKIFAYCMIAKTFFMLLSRDFIVLALIFRFSFFFFWFFLQFYFIFKLYIIVLVLPNIKMNLGNLG